MNTTAHHLNLILTLACCLSGCEGVVLLPPCDTAEEPVVDQWMVATDVNDADHSVGTTPAWPDELDDGDWTLREGVAVAGYACAADAEPAVKGCHPTDVVTDYGYTEAKVDPGERGVLLMRWYRDVEDETPDQPHLVRLLVGSICEAGEQDCYALVPDADADPEDVPLASGVYAGAGLVGNYEPLTARAKWSEGDAGWHIVVDEGAYHDDVQVVLAWLR